MRIKYYVYEEVAGDEEHNHELVRHSGYDKLENAQIALKTLTLTNNLYARIEKHEEEYTPPPVGRQYKNNELGWSTEKTEVIEEN